MQELGLEILLDDDCLLAINKPSGLPTQAPRQFDSVERRVRAWLAEQATLNAARGSGIESGPHSTGERPAYLGVPHRLDRPASGVLLMAKTPRAARLVSRQFERRQIEKTYWACVSGTVSPVEGTWMDRVRKLPSVPKVEIVAADAEGSLEAILHYRVIGETPHGSLLEVGILSSEMRFTARQFPLVRSCRTNASVPLRCMRDRCRFGIRRRRHSAW
jgi:23S rRNA pseudouridine1911/1915/1917 synthase